MPSLRHIAGAFLLAIVAGCTSVDLGERALAGTWVPLAAELGGRPVALGDFGGNTLRLTADRYAFGEDRGTYWVVSPGPPARLDLQGEQGPNAGRIILAIYRLSAARLTICYQLGGGPPPTEFASPPDSQILLVQYRRS